MLSYQSLLRGGCLPPLTSPFAKSTKRISEGLDGVVHELRLRDFLELDKIH